MFFKLYLLPPFFSFCAFFTILPFDFLHINFLHGMSVFVVFICAIFLHRFSSCYFFMCALTHGVLKWQFVDSRCVSLGILISRFLAVLRQRILRMPARSVCLSGASLRRGRIRHSKGKQQNNRICVQNPRRHAEYEARINKKVPLYN